MKRLNLGCGDDIRPGWVNLDSVDLQGVDVVHDIARLPLPFADGEFDEILCKDILEHLDYVPVLRELHRILRPGGHLHVRSPHFSSRTVWVDPTHRHGFSVDTLKFFVQDEKYSQRAYYFDFHFARVARARIDFHLYRYEPWNRVVRRLVNRSWRTQEYYESTAACRLFPATDIDVTLER